MNYKQHGAAAACLVLVSFCVAGFTVLSYGSLLLFGFYIAVVIVSLALVLFSYCRKCYQRNGECVHLNLGALTRFMPEAGPGKYSFFEIAGTLLGVLPLVLYPQYWLMKDMRMLTLYWLISAAAATEIMLFVCSGCRNGLCFFCRNRAIVK